MFGTDTQTVVFISFRFFFMLTALKQEKKKKIFASGKTS